MCGWFLFNASHAQKYLVLDHYGYNRTLLKEGDRLNFRQIGHKTWYQDKILALKDTSLILEFAQMDMPLHQFSEIRFQRNYVMLLAKGSDLLAGGFLFSALVYPLVGNPNYAQKEAATIGTSMFVVGRTARLFRWKVYRFRKEKARIKILNTSFK